MQAGSREATDSARDRLLDRLLDRHPLAARGSEANFDLASLGAEATAALLRVDREPTAEPTSSRIGAALLRRRADLRRAFPDPTGRSRRAFAYWLSTWGRAEYGLEWTLIRPIVERLPFESRIRIRLWWLRFRLRRVIDRLTSKAGSSGRTVSARGKLNLLGWTRSPTGVAQACRGTIEALSTAGVEHVVTSLDDLPDLPSPWWAEKRRDRCRLPVQLFHVNADMMDFVYRRLPPSDPMRPAHRIGIWFWELSQFPADLHWTFRFVDEVWCPSRFCFAAVSEFAPVPTHLVPPCVPAPVPQPGARTELDIPAESFLFFSSFDARSIAQRKNPVGLVEAFAQVVSRTGRKVRLLFNVVHPEEAPDLVELLREQTYQLPITLLTGGVSRVQYAAMLTACDAYVSLHRSEGLGLPLIEAMYLEKPVIATDYGGCRDFLDVSTGWPIDYRIVRIEQSVGPYPAGAKWAQPDVGDAVEKMLSVVEQPSESGTRRVAGRTKVTELYSVASAGARMRAHLLRRTAESEVTARQTG